MNNYKKLPPIILLFIILLSIPVASYATPSPLISTTDIIYKQIIDEIGQGILFNVQLEAYLNRTLAKQIREAESKEETESKPKPTTAGDWTGTLTTL